MKAQNKCHRLFDKCALVWQAGIYEPETLPDDFHRAVLTRKAPHSTRRPIRTVSF